MNNNRSFPRTAIEIPLTIVPNITGKTKDISETGFCLVSEHKIPKQEIHVDINVSKNEKVSTRASIVWSQGSNAGEKHTYGLRFDKITTAERNLLQYVALKTEVEPLLSMITDNQLKDDAREFWHKNIFKYLQLQSELEYALEHKRIERESAYLKLEKSSYEIIKKGHSLTKACQNKKFTTIFKNLFRKLTSGRILKSNLICYSLSKPRGYAGDYKIIEQIYNNIPLSEGIGYCYDKYLLANEYPVAVRNRKNGMKKILSEQINKSTRPLDILNIACGPCREIRELFQEKLIASDKKVHFSLVDHDNEALLFSEKQLVNVPSNIQFTYFQHNIFDYIKSPEKYYPLLGAKDLVYTIGLADYLPEKILKKLILFSFALLKPQGKLVIAHKDSKNYEPIGPDWHCDWTFHLRDEAEVTELLETCGLSDYSFTIERESSNVIFFITVTKRA
jgi:hypothetical protein